MRSIERFAVKNHIQITPSDNRDKFTLEFKDIKFTVKKHKSDSRETVNDFKEKLDDYKLIITDHNNLATDNIICCKTQKAIIKEIENYLKNI